MERLRELAGVPGWGVVFTAWTAAAAVGLAMVAVAVLFALLGRARRRRGAGGR